MSNMPEDKTTLTLYTSKAFKKRFMKYAETQRRSASQMAEIILSEHLASNKNPRKLV